MQLCCGSLGCGSHTVALLAACSHCLALDLLPRAGQRLALVPVTRADPDVTPQLDLVTRGFPGVGAWLRWCCLGLPCSPCSGSSRAVPGELTAPHSLWSSQPSCFKHMEAGQVFIWLFYCSSFFFTVGR